MIKIIEMTGSIAGIFILEYEVPTDEGQIGEIQEWCSEHFYDYKFYLPSKISISIWRRYLELCYEEDIALFKLRWI